MELEGLTAEATGALCCATSLRIGGALYILAEAAGFEDSYYRVDAGLRAGMRSYEGRELNSAALEEGLVAHQELSATFPSGRSESEFFRAGLDVVGLGLEAISREASPDLVAEVFQKAMDAASLLQALAGPGPEEFELACQEKSVTAARVQGIAGVRKVAGEGALQYRRVAQSVESNESEQ
ncbi:hypothetical protein [Streptomyces sp. NPDC050804]|uniref:hypothetical protein n=1 Tax=unclassified Streptomyces TaxID=2593676 RepID=UPI00342B0F69|nr:hypothetical protein OG214_20765 [Streptomyces sp. NBC_00872]